jgi:cyclophilin family peptidyl-prolyl cis-trans isomerase
MKRVTYFVFAFVILVGCKNEYSDLKDGIYADMDTDKGKIIFEMYPDQVPLTVANFVSLAEGNNPKVVDSLSNKPYFDELGFHRVVKDFMIQGGDPRGDGLGGPGYKFYSEFDTLLSHNAPGIVSMANSGGLNTNGSQFFITHKPTPWLDGFFSNGRMKDCSKPGVSCHTVFGKVVRGLSLIDSIERYDMIKSLKIVRIGEKAKSFDAVKVFNEEFDKGAERERERLAQQAEAEKARYEKFLQDKEVFHKKMGIDKAQKKESGLQMIAFKKGKGKKFDRSKLAEIDYTIYLADGTLIQSSEGKQTLKFIMDQQQLIAGVTEAILTMREGGKKRLFIPYYIGYGEQGGGPFPKKADLVFDLTLLKVGE